MTTAVLDRTSQTHFKRESSRVKNKTGATRKKRRSTSNGESSFSGAVLLAWIIRICVFSMLIVGAIFIGVFIREKVTEITDRSVTAVLIDGELKQVSVADLERLVAPLVDESFLSLDLNALKKQLEQDPWIAQVTLSRQWPDKLRVAVVEETAIARWGDTGFLNPAGEKIIIGDNSALSNLPRLSGPTDSEIKVAEAFMSFSKILSNEGLHPTQLELTIDHSWQMILSNGLKIKLGKKNLESRLERLITVYQADLNDKVENINTIDLRYTNGIAVSWNEKRDNSLER